MSLGSSSSALAADCRFTQTDKQVIREVAIAVERMAPAVARVTKSRPTRSDFNAAATQVARAAGTARAGQARASNRTLRRVLGLYATGLGNVSLGIRVVAAGDASRGEEIGSRGQGQYRRGQEVFFDLARDCGLSGGSLAP